MTTVDEDIITKLKETISILKGDDLSSLVTTVIDSLGSNSITAKKGGSTTIKGGMIIEGYAFYAGTGLGVGILNMLLTFLAFLAIIASAIAATGTTILLYKALEGLFQILVYKYTEFKTRFIKPTSKIDLVKYLGFDESRRAEINKGIAIFNHVYKNKKGWDENNPVKYYLNFYYLLEQLIDHNNVLYGNELVAKLNGISPSYFRKEMAKTIKSPNINLFYEIKGKVEEKVKEKKEQLANPVWREVPDDVAEKYEEAIDEMGKLLSSTPNKGGGKTKKKMKRKGRKTNRKK